MFNQKLCHHPFSAIFQIFIRSPTKSLIGDSANCGKPLMKIPAIFFTKTYKVNSTELFFSKNVFNCDRFVSHEIFSIRRRQTKFFNVTFTSRDTQRSIFSSLGDFPAA